MDPEEARQTILDSVKRDKTKMQGISQAIKDKRAMKTQLEEKIKRIQHSLSDKKDNNDDDESERAKIQQMQTRQAEMSQFIENFADLKKKEVQSQNDTQGTIVALLEHISEQIDRKTSMPDSKQVAEMEQDLSFKEKHLEQSQMTKDRLEQELIKRQGELEKIKTLDEKIQVEREALIQKREIMESDLIEFKKVDSLKDQADETK